MFECRQLHFLCTVAHLLPNKTIYYFVAPFCDNDDACVSQKYINLWALQVAWSDGYFRLPWRPFFLFDLFFSFSFLKVKRGHKKFNNRKEAIKFPFQDFLYIPPTPTVKRSTQYFDFLRPTYSPFRQEKRFVLFPFFKNRSQKNKSECCMWDVHSD